MYFPADLEGIVFVADSYCRFHMVLESLSYFPSGSACGLRCSEFLAVYEGDIRHDAIVAACVVCFHP
jgi:hypothetical protein